MNSDFFQNHSLTKPIKTQIHIVSIDDWCLDQQIKPGFIKIDVEGYEAEVLRGARRVLADSKPGVLCEIFTKKCEPHLYEEILPNVHWIENAMKELGYSISVSDDHEFLHVNSLNIDSRNRNFLIVPG